MTSKDKRKIVTSCLSCGKDATLICSKCRSVRYCCKDCQQQNWNIHKKMCVEYVTHESKDNCNQAKIISRKPLYAMVTGAICHFVKLKSTQHLRCVIIKNSTMPEDCFVVNIWIENRYSNINYMKGFNSITTTYMNSNNKHSNGEFGCVSAIDLDKCQEYYNTLSQIYDLGKWKTNNRFILQIDFAKFLVWPHIDK